MKISISAFISLLFLCIIVSCRKEFDMMFPSENSEPKPCLQVYQLACRFLLVWQKERDKERFEKLCRYSSKIIYS